MSLLPINLVEILEDYLESQRREPSGLLRASSEITGSLRHAQLRLAGAPTRPLKLRDWVALEYGTYWHHKANAALAAKGIPVVQELSVTPWLPKGWGGVADYLFFDPEYKAWVLADLKTQRGEGFQYLTRDGAKEDHIWQLSAYWHALADAGFELVKGFALIYLPKNDVRGEAIEPYIAECDPIERDLIHSVMGDRSHIVKKYLEDVEKSKKYMLTSEWLEAPQERIQKMWWQEKTKTWDVKLVPHWSAEYCPYPDEFCDCYSRWPKSEKIGHWVANPETERPPVTYIPRKGYERIEPFIKPDKKEIAKRASKTS